MKIPKIYKGRKVKIVRTDYPNPIKNTLILDPGVVYGRSKLWMGSWSIDRNKKITIYLQGVYADALRRTNSYKKMMYTLEHEYRESNFVEKKLSRLEEDAHNKTIRSMHTSYKNPIAHMKKMQNKEIRLLGLKKSNDKAGAW